NRRHQPAGGRRGIAAREQRDVVPPCDLLADERVDDPLGAAVAGGRDGLEGRRDLGNPERPPPFGGSRGVRHRQKYRGGRRSAPCEVTVTLWAAVGGGAIDECNAGGMYRTRVRHATWCSMCAVMSGPRVDVARV